MTNPIEPLKRRDNLVHDGYAEHRNTQAAGPGADCDLNAPLGDSPTERGGQILQHLQAPQTTAARGHAGPSGVASSGVAALNFETQKIDRPTNADGGQTKPFESPSADTLLGFRNGR